MPPLKRRRRCLTGSKSRPSEDDPEVIARRQEREAILAARAIRDQEREKARQEKLAREAAEKAERERLAEIARKEAEEQARLEAEARRRRAGAPRARPRRGSGAEGSSRCALRGAQIARRHPPHGLTSTRLPGEANQSKPADPRGSGPLFGVCSPTCPSSAWSRGPAPPWRMAPVRRPVSSRPSSVCGLPCPAS